MKFFLFIMSLIVYDCLLMWAGLIASQKYNNNVYGSAIYLSGYLIPASIGTLWLGKKIFKDFYPAKLLKEIDMLKGQLWGTQADHRNMHGEGYYQAVNEMNVVVEGLRDENKILRDAVEFGIKIFNKGYMYNVFARALRLATNSQDESTAAKLKTEIALMSNDHQMIIGNLNQTIELINKENSQLSIKLSLVNCRRLKEVMYDKSVLFGNLNAVEFIKEVGIDEFGSLLSRVTPLVTEDGSDA